MSPEPPAAAPAPLAEDDLREGLWDVADVARFLKISARSVYDLPGMPCVRLRITGARHLRRFVPAEVRAWARARLSHSMTRGRA
jgi:hypothetical protein